MPTDERTLVPSTSHWGRFDAVVDGDEVVELISHTADPDPNELVHGVRETLDSPVRVERPAIRESWLRGIRDPEARRPEARGEDRFVEVSWETALDAVADELRRVREAHGNESLFAGSYGWASAGRFHHARTQLHRFMNSIGGYVGQVGNYSYGAAHAILPRVVGDVKMADGEATSWPVIARHTELWVLFGGMPLKNTQVESGGITRHTARGWMRRIAEGGTRVVSISPLRDDAAGFPGAEWLAPRPGSDTAIMLALTHTLVAEGLHDEGFLARYCEGWDRFAPYLLGETDGVAKDAEWAAGLTGLEAEQIRDLARRMAGSRTMVTVNWALQRADHGEQTYWAAVALASALGQIGLPGGGFGFGYGATGTIGQPRYPFPAPVLPTGVNPVDASIPVARIADMLLHPGEEYDFNGERRRYPDARLVYWAGGNPFHHHQDLNRLIRAWQRPETIVVNEPFWTATARHADIVLPATTSLERNDIAAASHDAVIVAMKRAVAPRHQARSDYEIFSALAERLGAASRFTEGRDEMEWIRAIYATTRANARDHGIALPEFEEFWRSGSVEVPVRENVLLADFRIDPEAHPLRTPSGRIEIFSQTIADFEYDDCPGHPAWIEPTEWLGADLAARYPLHLISNQPAHRLHSQLDHAGAAGRAKVAGREPCRLNSGDAAARGICDGDVIRLFNDRGACLAGVELSDDVRPGVVQLSTGAWYEPAPGDRSLELHGNPNVLTRDRGTSRLAQGPSAQSTLVDVERYAGDAAPVTVTSRRPLASALSSG